VKKKEQNKGHPVTWTKLFSSELIFFLEKQPWFEMMCGHVSLSKKKQKWLSFATQFEPSKKFLSNYPKQGSPSHWGLT